MNYDSISIKYNADIGLKKSAFWLTAFETIIGITKVVLLKEGMFWRVYEKSAMQFVIPI